MIVSRHESQLYSSKIYVLEDALSDYCWLVDIGSKDLSFLPDNKIVKGLFITHTHIDHILGINDLLVKYPNCIVYVNEAGREGLYDDKQNLTFYHEEPLCFIGGDVRIIKEGDKMQLFDGTEMEFIETPGHHPSCVCYKADRHLFTGDSYFLKMPVVTKLKGGDKEQALKSIALLSEMRKQGYIIHCGH